MPPSTDPLAPYRRKRDFARTPEPSGAVASGGSGRLFVVQRHRASRLHYDFRLEIDGVLVSWAVPKGPTLDPTVRRGAFHVEDHPLSYYDFEGVIPGGQYGGGDVIVWDAGEWAPQKTDDPGAAVAAGELHMDLFGEKLKGRFVLIHTRDKQWIMLHKHDEYAVDGWNPEDYPRSVLSGRTNDEVKAHPDRVWHSNRSDSPGPSSQDLSVLSSLGDGGTWEIFGRTLRLTNLDKELFHGGITKRDLVAYAAAIAPTAVPYLAGRPVNLHRFPGGAQTKGFWQKELPSHAPAWLPRWKNPGAAAGEAQNYLVVDEPAALVWAANNGALEWHPWTSRADAPQRPTYALIDLDPGPDTAWEDVLTLARLHRDAFEHLGVTARAKVTGRRGIQIWVPIAPGPTFAETRAWVERLSRTVGAVVPDLVSFRWTKNDRSGRARLDYTQNALNRTLVAPYSPRAAAGAPVSAPIEWDELDDPLLRPDGFTVRDILPRLAQRGDLFRDVLDHPQRLPRLD